MRYLDAPICRDENTDTDGACDDERLYYLTDANMNVTAVVDDSTGAVVERYAYDPYGKVSIFDASWSARSSSSHDVSVLYCGYYRDSETGLYHVRRRVYHATLGWLQRDPLGYVDGPGLYEYCTSRAVAASDPYGLLLPGGWSSWGDEEWVDYWKVASPAGIWNDLDSIALARILHESWRVADGAKA